MLLWSEDYLLNWSDFKAESNLSAFEDSSSHIKFHYTWLVNSEVSGDRIYFLIEDIRLSTQFLRHLSWVREAQDTSDLLKHEQGHFDLAESLRPIITEKIQKSRKEQPQNLQVNTEQDLDVLKKILKDAFDTIR